MDGPLGLLFCYRGQWRAASRGSFVSRQTHLADQLLRSQYSDPLDSSLTYIYDLIHPDNHVLVAYKSRAEMVLLEAYQKDGSEVFPLPEASLASSGFPLMQDFSGENFTSLEAFGRSGMEEC